MKKLVLNISFCFFAVSLLFLNTANVHAQTFNTETVKPIEEGNSSENNTQNDSSSSLDIGSTVINSNLTAEDYANPSNAAQAVVSTNASVEGIFNKITSKIGELISDWQSLCMTLCIGAFIVSVMIAVMGALGRKGPMQGIIGAIVSAVAFTCVKYGPEIVASISAWLVS